MIGVLHRASEIQSQSNIETTLIHCARDVIAKGTAMYNSSMSPRSYTGLRENDSRSHVTEWIRSLELLQQDTVTPHEIATDVTDKHQINNVTTEESDDDLETDLTRASLETGAEAFDVREWNEANSLLQEALRGLQQLPKHQRAFCDMFDLHYKLSVCAYHTQPPADAEIALQSLIRQPARSDEDRIRIYDATHLLSQIYIRMGKYGSAQADCEKALQARRRILGKQSEASLESLALMAHIYVLLNNRARAKSCLSMIPEKQRDATLRKVEESLGAEVEHLDFSLLLTRPTLEDTELRLERRNSGSTLGIAMEDQSFRSPSLMARTPAPSIRQPYRQSLIQTTVRQGLHAVNRATSDAASIAPSERLEAETVPKNNHLSRKEILARIGCQPKDQIEELVCAGDHPALVNILGKKKEIWRSKFRKHVRPERLTALHFAALFGEIDMARRLLSSGFNINDVPYGYTTSLSPLKIAIGARQVGMVEFLIENNARPAEPESWASLAGQLMSRSWLEKTLSEADKDITPNRIVSIMSILIKRGWNVNSPFEASGNTVLHQAVSFWTGSYIWDLHLRIAVTTFLCQRGANPFYGNKDGKTPYDLALASGHRDILMILDQDSKGNVVGDVSAQPVELSG
jgi:ankyrin repeat protein